VHRRRGDLEAAVEAFDAALAIVDELGDATGTARALQLRC
jgi:hypothetical protein